MGLISRVSSRTYGYNLSKNYNFKSMFYQKITKYVIFFLIFYQNQQISAKKVKSLEQLLKIRRELKPSMREVCYGYEDNCYNLTQYSTPTCNYQPTNPWAKSQPELENLFSLYSDFKYVKKKTNQKHKIHSNLKCLKHLRYCEGHSIALTFDKSMKKMTNRDTYRTDVLNDFSFICDYQKIFDSVKNKDLYGNQGAAEKKFENCLTKVDSSFIDENANHLGALQ